MIRIVKLEEKALLRQKGWMLFASVLILQILFVVAGYFLSAA